MQDYDVTLKELLRSSPAALGQIFKGEAVAHWLNVELPEVQNPRVDLLAESKRGELLHLELQSTNDPQMGLRMIEYHLRIHRQFARFAKQVVLYVGAEPLRMPPRFQWPGVTFECQFIDIRNLDAASLLESSNVGDNVLAILGSISDPRAAILEILQRIARLYGPKRDLALQQLLILAGLRKLELTVLEETRSMPITEDIMQHQVIGPEYRRGRQQGIEQGIQQGIQQGELSLLHRLLEKKFGKVPAWVEEKLLSRTLPEIEAIGVKILETPNLEDLF